MGRADVSREAAYALHAVSLLAYGRWTAHLHGRLLSHRELSTTGDEAEAPAAGAEDDPHGEQAFLYGAFGRRLGPVHLGLEMRPPTCASGSPAATRTWISG